MSLSTSENQGLIFGCTGHRPEHLCNGYEYVDKVTDFLVEILPSYHPQKLYLGMALGFDQCAALAAIRVGVPFIAAVPFEGQESRWAKEAQKLYHEILSKAEKIVIVSPGGYAHWKFIKRDEYMVDNSHEMLACWSGIKLGGTFHTIKYAEKKNKNVNNVWIGWQEKAEKDYGLVLE